MTAAAFFAVQGVEAEKFGELHEVGHASGFLELGIAGITAAGDDDIGAELFTQLGDAFESLREAGAVAGHAAFVPDEETQLAVEAVHAALALAAEEALRLRSADFERLLKLRMLGGDAAGLLMHEVVRDGRRDDEIAIGEALHERGGTEAVRAVIGEVRLAEHMEAGEVAHEVVVHPQAAHRVMHSRVDTHGLLVAVFTGDLFIHGEKIAVALGDGLLTELADGLREVEINTSSARADATSVVTGFLGGAGGNVTRGEVAEARVFALQDVVAVCFRDLCRWLADIGGVFRHPDTAVIAQRLRHERELALIIAAHGNAGRVNLRVTGVREVSAFLVRTPRRGDVAAHRIGGEVEHIAVAAGAEQHRIARVGFDFTGDEVARDDALRMAVHGHHIEHLRARIHLHTACGDFLVQSRVSTEQELLTRLAASIKRAAHLSAAEGAVRQHAAVFAGKGHALRHALVDDVHADLGQTMHVGLASAEVAAFDRVIKEAMHAIAVVLVVLRRIDAALGRDGVRTTGGILEAEALHLVAQLRERRRGRGTGQAAAHDEHGEFALVLRIDELRVLLVLGPLHGHRATGNMRFERHGGKEQKGFRISDRSQRARWRGRWRRFRRR